MKQAYPVIFTPDKTGFTAFIPDFNINTQGGRYRNVKRCHRSYGH